MKKLYTFLCLILLSYPLLVRGQLTTIVINQDSVNRIARIYIPSAYTGEEPWPLVLNFHGALIDIDGQVAHGMNETAETKGFLVAYPQGMEVKLNNPLLPDRGSGWNIGGGLSENEDLAFINSLLDKIEADYNIDPARIYATGFSMGGMMSYYLACSFPDRIAGVASVAGGLSKPGRLYDCEPERAIPVLHIHGTDDPLTNYFPTTDSPLFSAEGTTQFWVDNNNCTDDPVETEAPDTDTEDESTVTIFHHNDCAEGAEVLLYRVNEGRHSWPGTPVPPPTAGAGVFIIGKANMDINANEVILDFFGRHPLTSTRSPLRPEEVQLSVFPSPFSDRLTFTFELPESARVRLTVFNSIGQVIPNLVDQQLPAGQQRVEWQTPSSRLPAGIYYYKLWIDARFVSQAVVKQ